MKKRTLLFDLGGVIINLDTRLTIKAFSGLCKRSEKEVIDAWHIEPAFKQYERGEVSDDQFRAFLRNWLGHDYTDEVLDDAWNAMILDLPAKRLDFLKELKKDFQVLLLSNTNYIHMRRVNERVKESVGEETLEPFFHKTYYSHLLGMRKPEKRIYQAILDMHTISGHEMLFLDDNTENIEGAKAVGIATFVVEDPEQIFTITQYV